MSLRIRKKERTLRLAIDGQDQVAGFLKVVDFEINPEMTMTKTQFCGELFKDADVDCDGFTGSFEVQELDATAEDLLNTMFANHEAYLAQPLAVITEYKKYRGVGAGGRTNVYGGATLICKTITSGSDYVSSKWEFFVPKRQSF